MRNANKPQPVGQAIGRSVARGRGLAMLMVLMAVSVSVLLSVSFLMAHSMNTAVMSSVADQAQARAIAESGLAMAMADVRRDATWRTRHPHGTWASNQSLAGGSFDLSGVDGVDEDGDGDVEGDGSLTDDATDLATLTVVGRFGSATHTSRAVVRPGTSGGYQAGLKAEYFNRGSSLSQLSQINWAGTPGYTEVVPQVNRVREESGVIGWPGGPAEYWGVRYTGRILIPQTGTWTFWTESDDGSDLTIDGTTVVNNDGLHSMQLRSGTAYLTAGYHTFTARLFENTVHQGIIVSWSGPGVASRTVVPADAFSHEAEAGSTPAATSSNGLVASHAIEIWGQGSGKQCYIDAFNASAGGYTGPSGDDDDDESGSGVKATVMLNSTSSGAFRGERFTIYGDLRIGPGGNPDSVVETYSKAKITGTTAAASATVTIPTPAAPSGMPSSSGYLSLWTGTTTFSTNARYSGWSISGNNTVMRVTAPITIVVDGEISISDGAELRIESGGSLDLYVYGHMGVYNNSRLNVSSGSPSKLKIYMMGNNKSLTLTDRAKVWASAINRLGGLYVWGTGNPGSEFYGTYMGKTLTMGDHTRFHIDVGGGGATGGTGDDTTPSPPSFTWIEGP